MRDRGSLMGLIAGAGLGAGAMEILASQPTYRPVMLFNDPFEELASIRRVLDTRARVRRLPRIGRYRGKPSNVPTSKRAKVKAARKANLRRIQSC